MIILLSWALRTVAEAVVMGELVELLILVPKAVVSFFLVNDKKIISKNFTEFSF